MQSYIWIGLLAYLCFAAAAIGDKFILNRAIKHPFAYAFYIGLFSPIVLVLAPFGLRFLTAGQTLIALLGGVSFAYALVFLYRATDKSGASKAVTMVGGLQPLFVLALSFWIADERLSTTQIGAFVAMVLGSLLISLEKVEGKWSAKAIWNAVMAALLFALAFALYKNVYNHTNFISGLVWSRLGLTVGSLSFLLYKPWRDLILGELKTKKTNRHKLAFLGNFIIGSSGGFLQNLAISLGSVSIVSALGGVQFAFVLVLAYVLTRYSPKILVEDISLQILFQKIIAILLIASGLVMLNV